MRDLAGNRVATIDQSESDAWHGQMTSFDALGLALETRSVIASELPGGEIIFEEPTDVRRLVHDTAGRVIEEWVDDPTDPTDDPDSFPVGFVLHTRNHYDSKGRLIAIEDADGLAVGLE